MVERVEFDIAQGNVEVYYSAVDNKISFAKKQIKKEDSLNPIEKVKKLELRYIKSGKRFFSKAELNTGGLIFLTQLEKDGYSKGKETSGGMIFNKQATAEATITLSNGTVIVLPSVRDSILKFGERHYNRTKFNEKLVERILSEIGLEMIEVSYDTKNRKLIFTRNPGLLAFV